MDAPEIAVLDPGVEVEEVAASATCCKIGPRANLPEPDA